METRKEFYVVSEIWDMDLSCRARTVFAYLSYCSNRNGESFPSVARIAKECGMSENTARRKLNELIDKGFISSRPRMVKTINGNRQTSNVYRILLERGSRKSAPKPPESAAEKKKAEKLPEAPAQAKPEAPAPAAMNALPGMQPASAAPPAKKPEDDDEAGLERLLERLDLKRFSEDGYAARALEFAITDLWYAEQTKICGDLISKKRMRRRLKELDQDAIDDVMDSMGEEGIENKASYIKACLYNAPMRANARIAVQCAGLRTSSLLREGRKRSEYGNDPFCRE